MTTLPPNPSAALKKRNPHLWPDQAKSLTQARAAVLDAPKLLEKGDRSGRTKPLLNKTEQRWLAVLRSRNYGPILEQAITLRLDSPFKSYRADLATFENGQLVLWECKAPHRFARAGIAKAACAAKTYPSFKFVLAMWDTKTGWKETVLSP